jgi:hypothetical protein
MRGRATPSRVYTATRIRDEHRKGIVHVDLIALVCLIFVTFGFIGSSIVDQLGGGFNPTRRWLLAPMAGLAAVVLVATVLSRLGFPARAFGPYLIGALVAINGVYWLVRRPRFDWRPAAVWASGFLAVLLLVGWPLIVGGYDWISQGNGDMTVYLLGATHFYEHGYYQVPPLHDLMSEVDPSWDLSFYYSIGEVRSASQLFVALFMSVSSLDAAQSYMIVLLAIHLVMLSAVAALVCSSAGREKVAFAALLVTGSAANLLKGTFLQLMPQDLGIAALAACGATLLSRPGSGKALYGQGILAGIFLAAQLVVYPELTPFIVFAVGLYATIAFVKGNLQVRRWLLSIGAAATTAVVGANLSVPGALHLVLWSANSSKEAAKQVNTVFPYYLTPLGLALGWGFVPMGSAQMSSWPSQVSILAGGLLCVVALIFVIREAWRLEASALVAAPLILAVVPLYLERNGFGLFKLAMYAPPFLLSVLTIAVWRALLTSAPLGGVRVPARGS